MAVYVTCVKAKLPWYQEIPVGKIRKFHSTGTIVIDKPSHAPVLKLDVTEALLDRRTGLRSSTISACSLFLESCQPNLVEFLPVILEASIKDDVSLTELVLNSRAARLSFLSNTFKDASGTGLGI